MRDLSERILKLLRENGLHGHVTYGTGTIAAVIVVTTERLEAKTMPPPSGDTGLLWEDQRPRLERLPDEVLLNVALRLPR